MKFFLFAGDEFYPRGGWKDYKGRFNTREEALEAAVELKTDWVQIVNVRSGEIVYETGKK